MIQCLFAMLFFIHVFSCIWLTLGRFLENGWVKRSIEFNNDDNQSFKPYIAAYYFITTTITTIGYGEFLPYETLEMIFVMSLELLGLATFSFILGTMTSIELTKSAEIIENNNKGMNLPTEIYNNAIKNFEFIHDYGIKYIFNLHNFNNDLKPKCSDEVAFSILKNIYIDFIEFFTNKELEFQADDKFILSFLSNLECQIVLPGKPIIQRGEQLEYLYLIAKGSVFVYSHKDGNLIATLPTHCHFGDYQLFLDTRSNVSYCASPDEKVFLYVLNKDIFLNLCREFENHLEFFMKRALETRKLFKRLIIRSYTQYTNEEEKTAKTTHNTSLNNNSPVTKQNKSCNFLNRIQSKLKATKLANRFNFNFKELAKDIKVSQYFEEHYLTDFGLK